jgi:hypothetical protein
MVLLYIHANRKLCAVWFAPTPAVFSQLTMQVLACLCAILLEFVVLLLAANSNLIRMSRKSAKLLRTSLTYIRSLKFIRDLPNGCRAFQSAAPTIWNHIPVRILDKPLLYTLLKMLLYSLLLLHRCITNPTWPLPVPLIQFFKLKSERVTKFAYYYFYSYCTVSKC